ncbi:hypothetical protein ACWD0Z_02455 [Streptomyces sp. NPDC003007]
MTVNGDSTTSRAHGRVTRRTLLKTAGATALTAGAVTATGLPPQPTASPTTPSSSAPDTRTPVESPPNP